VWAEDVFQRPTNKNVVLPQAMLDAGIQNTEDGIAGLDGLTNTIFTMNT
jgi:hypothetical protein